MALFTLPAKPKGDEVYVLFTLLFLLRKIPAIVCMKLDCILNSYYFILIAPIFFFIKPGRVANECLIDCGTYIWNSFYVAAFAEFSYYI